MKIFTIKNLTMSQILSSFFEVTNMVEVHMLPDWGKESLRVPILKLTRVTQQMHYQYTSPSVLLACAHVREQSRNVWK